MVHISASIGKDHYKTTLSNGRGHANLADEPQDLGGSDQAFAPDEFLASALAACGIITMRMYADRKEWPLEKIEVDVEFEREGAVSKFTKRVRFTGNLDEEQQQRLLSVGDKCPVHKTLSNPIEISSVLI
ncbi:MAG TPA: OsmC family protein [Phnomibacter sp.]|nr:OsmC family protein [Phnomibacter sp.]